jgi:hypothetical protein
VVAITPTRDLSFPFAAAVLAGPRRDRTGNRSQGWHGLMRR